MDEETGVERMTKNRQQKLFVGIFGIVNIITALLIDYMRRCAFCIIGYTADYCMITTRQLGDLMLINFALGMVMLFFVAWHWGEEEEP